RPPRIRVDPALRPADDPGHRAVRHVLHRAREPGRRHPLCLPRPAGQVRVSTDGAAGRGELLLDVKDLSVAFATEDGLVRAVDGVSLQVGRGQSVGIVGESGSGKSVSMLTIMGLSRQRNSQISGTAMFEGRDLLTASDAELRNIRGNDIAMIFQDPLSSLHPFYKVGKQLVEAIQSHQYLSKSQARQRAIEFLGMVGIPDPARRFDAYPHEFSGGMRQRAMIA